MRAPDHPEEARRISTLKALQLLDSDESAAWDRIAQLASLICDTPIALVSLIDSDRQWFKARVGLDVRETPRDFAFCGYAILQTDVFEVVDALADPRFVDNALVTGAPDIRAYAGAPIRASDGMPIGTVCAIDRQPRTLSDGQKKGLRLLADFAEDLTHQRSALLTLERFIAEDEDIQGARGVINRVSDELLNPLTAIAIQVPALRRAGAPEASLKTLERSIERLRDVIHLATDHQR